MDSFSNLSKLREMLAKYPKEIERSLNPMAEIIEAVEQARRQWAGMIEAIEQARNQWYDFAQTLAMSIERTKQQFQGVFLAYKQSIENIERIKLEWTKWTEFTRSVEKLNSFQMTEIYLANASWQSSITSIVESFRQSRLLESHPQFSNRQLEPYNCYSQFALKTLEQLGEEDPSRGEKRFNWLPGSRRKTSGICCRFIKRIGSAAVGCGCLNSHSDY